MKQDMRMMTGWIFIYSSLLCTEFKKSSFTNTHAQSILVFLINIQMVLKNIDGNDIAYRLRGNLMKEDSTFE